MASCSISGWSGADRSYTLTVTEQSYNHKTNTSVVKWTLSSNGGSTWYDYYLYASVNGTKVYSESGSWSKGSFPASTGSTSGTMTITHNSGGDKSISFYIEGYAYVYSTKSASGSLGLTKLDRAAPTVSASAASNITINSFNITASSNVTCSQWAWKIKTAGGSYGGWTYDNTSGTSRAFTISGLVQNTSYVIQLAGKKSVNDIWGYSAEISVKTLGASAVDSVTDVQLDYEQAASSTVIFTPLVSTFKYLIGFNVGGYEWWCPDYIVPGNTQPYTYVDDNFTINLANHITNVSTAVCTCMITTYDASGNQVGSTNTKSFNVSVPADMVPTVDQITITEGTKVSGFGRYAKNLSNARIKVEASGVYNSTIVSVYVTALDITYTAEAVTDEQTGDVSYVATTNDLTSIGQKDISVRVIDSRAKEVTNNTNNITVYDYFPPTGSYKIQTIGTTVRLELEGKVASVDGQNDFSVVMTRTKVDDPSDTETVTFYPSTWEFTQAWVQTVPDASTATFTYTVSIIDEKNTWTESQKTAIVTISRLRGGKGVTLFQEATNEGFWVRDVDYTISTYEFQTLASKLAREYVQKSYKKGSFVIHESGIYVSNQEIIFPEYWNSAHWDLVCTSKIGVNLITPPFYHEGHYIQSGITFDCPDYGNSTLTTVTGTSTGSPRFYYRRADNTVLSTLLVKLLQGTYRLIGCPQGGSASTYELRCTFYEDLESSMNIPVIEPYYSDYGEGIEFTVDAEQAAGNLDVRIVVQEGLEDVDVVFVPSLVRLS